MANHQSPSKRRSQYQITPSVPPHSNNKRKKSPKHTHVLSMFSHNQNLHNPLLPGRRSRRRSIPPIALVRLRRRLDAVLRIAVVSVIGVERGARALRHLLLAVGGRRVVVALRLVVALVLVVLGLVSLVVVVHLVLLVLVVLADGGHPACSVHGLSAAAATATSGAAVSLLVSLLCLYFGVAGCERDGKGSSGKYVRASQ